MVEVPVALADDMPDTEAPEGTKSPRPARERGAVRAARPVKRKPAEMPSEPWEDALSAALRARFGDAIANTTVLGGQKLVVGSPDIVPDAIAFLKDECQFDYLVDVTAVHWPERERQFDMVWILYSFAANERVRVKISVAEGEKVPSVASLYHAADWLEREVYDMFGIEFEGHPDLRRILLPDEWEGFPLRKDYSILQQDADWVRENLNIESAQ